MGKYLRIILVNIIILFNLVQFSMEFVSDDRSRVAIIGGGVGGTTAAYMLTQLSVEQGIEIEVDLYEPGNVGGRLATVVINGFEFEAGGSIIHNENKYMQQFADKFNLKKCAVSQPAGAVAFFNGKEFVYIESTYEVWSIIKFWWRYTFDLLSLGRQLIQPFLSRFKGIYGLQKNMKTFEDIHEILGALDPNFPPLLKTSIKHLLTSRDYGDNFIKEFLFAATNVNYNQDTNIHAFVGAVALAGAQGELWSVEGGNKKVPEKLLENSDARLIKKKVDSVFLMPSGRYALDANDDTHLYDYVIIACPLMDNFINIEFKGFPDPISVPVSYQKTVVTFVHGEVNPAYFKYSSSAKIPTHIFSVNNTLFFNSISVVTPVSPSNNYDGKVHKIFSKYQLTDKELDLLFLNRDEVTPVEWFAYPLYDTDDKNLPFVLHDNLFYVNAIEWAASAMEMSAISGVNAAMHVIEKVKLNAYHSVINALHINPKK